eukprot:jgi/Astpho2/5836/gw1.00080.153.1_t
MRVLDVATGTGIVALAASRQVHAGDRCGHVLGVDLSQDMLAKASAKAETSGLSNVAFQLGDVEDISFPQGSFDVILCSASLPYLWDLEGTLTRMRSWLAGTGRLIFNTPQV